MIVKLLTATLSLLISVCWSRAQIVFRDRHSMPSNCTTPFGIPGRCIPIMDCPELIKMIRGSPNDLKLVQQSRCGFQGSNPMVCCLQFPSILPEEPRVSTEPPQPLTGNNNTADLLPTRDCGISAFFKIIGGLTARLGAWPWAALLFYERNGTEVGQGCGGSLINNRYILTAAHCVTPELSEGATLSLVRLGEHDVEEEVDSEISLDGERIAPPPQNYKPEEIIKHPDFRIDENNVVWNDMALVRLDRPVDFNEFISPICLPDEVTDLSSQRDAYIIGWGALGPGQRSSTVLQQVNLPLVETGLCSLGFSSTRVTINLDPTIHLCAGGERGKDSCRGDSGGPLQVGTPTGQFYQIGVLSFGARRCGSVGTPGVYSNISSFRQWILDNIRP